MDEYEVTHVIYTGGPLNDIINYVYDISTSTQKECMKVFGILYGDA